MPSMNREKTTIAVIMGGGQGSRLYPLTLLRAKPAVPIAGKYRLVDVGLSNCINSGINKIFILTQFNSTSLHRHIVQTYQFGAFSNGFVYILAAEQRPGREKWFQGTADAVRQNLIHILTQQVERILILPGDALYRMDFRKFIAHHEDNGADISVAVNTVGAADVPRYGIMKIARDTRITHFLEKPKLEQAGGFEVPSEVLSSFNYTGIHPCYLASMGMYVFKASILNNVLQNEKWVDFGKDIIPNCVNRYKVYGYPVSNYWEDIGTIQSFYQAHMDFLKPNPPFNFLDPSAPIYTHPRILPNSSIENCQITRSTVSEGCILNGSKITQSIIGVRSIIRENSIVEDSLIMGNDYYEEEAIQESDLLKINGLEQPYKFMSLGIGQNCIIKRAIVDKNVHIGNNVSIINKNNDREKDGMCYFIRDGIVIIPKLAHIPDGTVI